MNLTKTRLALGVLEFSQVPSGIKSLNDIAKMVQLEGIHDQLLSGGRYIAFIVGEYATIQHAIEWVVMHDDGALKDIALIGNVQEELLTYTSGALHKNEDALVNLLIFETDAHAESLEWTNRLLHGTDLHLLDIDTSDALDGKTLVTLYGSIANIKMGQAIIPCGQLITNISPMMRKNIMRRFDHEKN